MKAKRSTFCASFQLGNAFGVNAELMPGYAIWQLPAASVGSALNWSV